MDGDTMRRWGPRALLAAAVLAIAISLIIGHNRYGPSGQWSLSQANGLCASAFGQMAQVTSARAASNCASVTATEQARGWLLVGGVVAGVLALGWTYWESRQRQSSVLWQETQSAK